MTKYLNDIDLQKHQLKNVVLHQRTTNPSNPLDGQIYYNTTDGKMYVYSKNEFKPSLTEITSSDIEEALGYIPANTNNLKTINNETILGNGNIDVSDVFIAKYNETSFNDILEAHELGKLLYVDIGTMCLNLVSITNSVARFIGLLNQVSAVRVSVTSENVWNQVSLNLSVSGLTGSKVLVSNSTGTLTTSEVSSTELDSLAGVTSNIQSQINNKQDKLSSVQLDAVNSGITADKVSTYDGYASQIDSKADTSSLATVATSGNYNDLTNKPTIPSVGNDSELVHKNGDEFIYGTKTFINTVVSTGFNAVIDAVLGETPSETKAAPYGLYDKNNNWIGGFESYIDTSGTNCKFISVRHTDGSENYGIFKLFAKDNYHWVEGTPGVTSSIVKWGMPNYNAGYSVSSGTTFSTNCMVVILAEHTGYTVSSVYVNNQLVWHFSPFGSTGNSKNAATFFVSKGDYITFNDLIVNAYPCFGG